MADRIWAKISIGGEVPRDLMMGLSDAITRCQVEGEVAEAGEFSPKDTSLGDYPSLEKYFEAFLNEDGDALAFVDEQAPNGEFEEIETFCRENNIAYDRMHICSGPYQAEYVYWRPGMSEPYMELCDDNGRELVDGTRLREIMGNLATFTTISGSSAASMLKELCPSQPETLAPFQWIN